MALSKTLHASRLFTQKAAGTDDLTGATEFVSSVNTPAGIQPTDTQWKLKELLLERGADTTAMTVTVLARDVKLAREYVIASSAGVTSTDYRLVPTLASGEYIFDSDVELVVQTSGMAAVAWTLRMTGAKM
jgi:hypothetical protein